jgi:hypothetical protein
MVFFTEEDTTVLVQSAKQLIGDSGFHRLNSKLLDLHQSLQSRIRNHNFFIQPHSTQSQVIQHESAAGRAESKVLTISYFRPSEEAMLVERLMGRELIDANQNGDTRFHPVIEMRLTPDHFVVELILAPDAWWDQENFVGKLSIRRHRNAFYKLIHEMDGDFRLGFWNGTHLSDMHLRTGQLAWTRALDEWMATFEEGRDWFRVGFWYDIDDPNLEPETIVRDVFGRIAALYKLYSFLLWTSNNDFHDVYQRHHSQAVYA